MRTRSQRSRRLKRLSPPALMRFPICTTTGWNIYVARTRPRTLARVNHVGLLLVVLRRISECYGL